MAGNVITTHNTENDSGIEPISVEDKIKNWLEVGWVRGAELVKNGPIPYDSWWSEMRSAAAGYWGCPVESKKSDSLVRPVYWGQMEKVFTYRANIGVNKSNPKKPSELVPKEEMGPSYSEDYVPLLLATLEVK